MHRPVLLLLVCTSLVHSTGYRRVNGDEVLLRAARAITAQERRAAIAGLDALIRDNVRPHDARLFRGDLLRLLGEEERALRDFREVVRHPHARGADMDTFDMARRRIDEILNARVTKLHLAADAAWIAKDYSRAMEHSNAAAELCLQSDFLVRRPGDGEIERKLSEIWLDLASVHAARHALLHAWKHVDQPAQAAARWRTRIGKVTSDPAMLRLVSNYLASTASSIGDEQSAKGDLEPAELLYFICSEQAPFLAGDELVTRCTAKMSEMQNRLGVSR